MIVIAFDLDGTLSDWPAAIDCALPAIMARHGVADPTAVRTRLHRHFAELHPRRNGHPVDHYHFRLLSDAQGVWDAVLPDDPRSVAIAATVQEDFRPVPYPDVIPALRALQDTARLTALSNSPRLERDLELMGLAPYFDGTVSLPPELRKPNPDGFRWAAAALGVAVEELIYVGDSLVCDVEGALAAGANPIWLDRDRTPLPVPLGAWRITTLTDLPTLIDQLIAAELLTP